MSEWIKFNSGVQPVLDGVKVTIKTAGGDIETGIAEGFAWELLGYDSDIVAFKVEDSPQVESIPRELSAREYAAIKLRVPDSGTDWLDAMIERSRMMDFAQFAMPEVMKEWWDNREKTSESSFDEDADIMASDCFLMAESMLKASKGE